MKNPRFANETSAVLLDDEDGNSIYVDQGPLLEAALTGEFGAIMPYVPPPAPDPLEVERAGMVASRFQAKAALYQAGLLASVEALLAGSASFLHKLAWEEAQEFRRDSPTIAHLAVELGLDDLAIDELFRLAMAIRA